MARTPMIAGNWKMNTRRDSAIELATAVREHARTVSDIEVETVVCPPFVYLHHVLTAIDGSTVKLGAQDGYWEDDGASTGEVSMAQIADLAEYVIIGHSERRQYFGETDDTVNKRVKAALRHRVIPIMCVGETLAQREGNETESVLVRQLRDGLDGTDILPFLVVAYEPVWAIGSGLAADGKTAQEAIGLIRSTLHDACGHVADDVRILYGGSVTSDNIAEFMAMPDIDGALVGGASLKAATFGAIIDATAASFTAPT